MYKTINLKIGSVNVCSLNKIISIIPKTILLYLFVYDIAFAGVSTLFSTKKIVFFILALWIVLSKLNQFVQNLRRSYAKRILHMMMGIMMVLLYSVFLMLIQDSDGLYVINYLAYFILYVPIGALLFLCVFEDIIEFFETFVVATYISVAFVFAQQFSSSFRYYLDSMFQNDDNLSYLQRVRAAIPGASGATLTIWLFLAMFACAYLIICQPKNRKSLLYYVSFLVFLCASVLSGTTGTLAGGVLLVFVFLFLLGKAKLGRLIGYLFLITVSVSSVIVVFQDKFSEKKIKQIFDRIFSIFESGIEQANLSELMEMELPELCFDTFLGTGIVRGTVGSLSCFHDSGYVQVYFGLGLIVSAVFYLIIYSTLVKGIIYYRSRIEKTLIFFLLSVLFVIEIKEPFCFKYNMVFFVALMNLLLEKEQERRIL